MAESTFVHHEPCPGCGSRDNLARYDDGHAFCFGCAHYEKGDGTVEEHGSRMRSLLRGNFQALTARRISAETCRRYGYLVTDDGRQAATYCDESGLPVAQKVRTRDKSFSWVHTSSDKKASPGLYGQHLWRGKGKMVIVTEGEIDALSYAEATGRKWPVVSVPNGAPSAAKAIAGAVEFLEGYERVIFAFDMDEPGRKAAKECAEILSPGKAYILDMPRKDLNEVLVDLGPGVVASLPWEAKPYRPDDLVLGSDLWEVVSTPPDPGDSLPYPWDGLNLTTFGMRKSEIVTLCAGSGIGKSTVVREIAHWLLGQGQTVGIIALEESVRRTALGLMSIELNHPLHLDYSVDQADLRKAFDATLGSGRVVLYDHWGSIEGKRLMAKIRSMVKTFGVQWLVLDHISIVVSGLETANERKDLDIAMTSLRSLAQELNIGIFVVSHLKRVDGRAFELGGEIHLSDLRGSAALEHLSDMVIGLERDQQGDAKNVLTIRVLKNRFSGDTGVSGSLMYNKQTGRLVDMALTPLGDL